MTGNGTPDYCFGLEWLPAYDELLGQIASTDVVDADWPILRDMLKYKLSEAIDSFLDAGLLGSLDVEEAHDIKNRAYSMLDSFTGPPFTIQRLCELLLAPRSHYASSLSKYLRAVNRVMNVTSTRSAFAEDDSLDYGISSTSSATLDSAGTRTHTGVILAGGMIPTRRPAAGRSPVTSPKALPVVVPLLSPIPWLTKDDSELDASTYSFNHSSHSTSSTQSNSSIKSHGSPTPSSSSLPPLKRSQAKAQLSSIPNPTPIPTTATPTGGLVDEVDPGSGGSETAAPIALTHASSSPPSKAESLAARFVRASSPRVEGPLRDAEDEGEASAETVATQVMAEAEKDADEMQGVEA